MNVLQVSPLEYHSKLRCNRSNILSSDSWLSKSVIWELETASLYKWRNCPKDRTPTGAMQWGSLIDCLTTSPELERETLALSLFDSFRTNDAIKWRDEQLAAGRVIVTADELAEGRKAARMLTETCEASAAIYAASKTQVVVMGRIRGVQVKGLIDLAPEGTDFLADLKTTSKFSLHGFQRSVAEYGYHAQAGLYLALWNSMFPNDRRNRFKFVWQDAQPPYEVAVTELAGTDIEAGFSRIDHHIRRLVEAARADVWPMAFEGAKPMIMRPTWAAIQEEERNEQFRLELPDRDRR